MRFRTVPEAPRTYAEISRDRNKWTRVTLYEETGNVTWAVAWDGKVQARGHAKDVEQARRELKNRVVLLLMGERR